MKYQGTVKWIAVGHDHSSDYWGTYGGMNLSLGRKSGYSSYGPKFSKVGARVLNLSIDQKTGGMTVDTWIRQDDGTVDAQEEYSLP
jgi:hypothetical protein